MFTFGLLSSEISLQRFRGPIKERLRWCDRDTLQVTGYRLQVTGFRLQVSCFTLQVLNTGFKYRFCQAFSTCHFQVLKSALSSNQSIFKSSPLPYICKKSPKSE